MMVQYLLDADAEVTIPGVAAPETEFADVVAPVALALEQEKRVSDQIAALVGVAREEGDYPERAVRAVVPEGAGRGGRDDVLAAGGRRALGRCSDASSRTTWRASTAAPRAPTRPRRPRPAARSEAPRAQSARSSCASPDGHSGAAAQVVGVAAADRDPLGVEVLEQRLGELARGAELVAQLGERDRAAVALAASAITRARTSASTSAW